MKTKHLKALIKEIYKQVIKEGKIQDPTKEEMMAYLKQQYGREEGWQHDAEVAIYWFANFYHGGQWSNLYSALSTSPFNPGPIARGPQRDSMEEMMYKDLVYQFAGGEGLDDDEGDEQVEEAFMPGPEGIVEYVKPFPGAKPFTIKTDQEGPQKFEVCIGKLPNGKTGLAIYAYRGDFAITVDHFNEFYGRLL